MRKTYGDLSIDLSKVTAFWEEDESQQIYDSKLRCCSMYGRNLHIMIGDQLVKRPLIPFRQVFDHMQPDPPDKNCSRLLADLKEFWRAAQ